MLLEHEEEEHVEVLVLQLYPLKILSTFEMKPRPGSLAHIRFTGKSQRPVPQTSAPAGSLHTVVRWPSEALRRIDP